MIESAQIDPIAMRLLFLLTTAAALDAVIDSKGQVLKKAPLLLQAFE